MTQIVQILDNYAKLRRYCDSFFTAVQQRYPGDMACKKGCFACCELHSVCAIEAHALAFYLKRRAVPSRKKRSDRSKCALCVNGNCAAYPARPVICRSHGLPLLLDKGKTVASSCDLNFSRRDPASLPASRVFDTAAITGNLVRLNMAFCMAAGITELASRRFTMAAVLAGELPEIILKSNP
ncbi:MAG TPA: hypothetical protein VLX68_04840 [Chitinivibrionales bacterium]|nr:hypothetical protein [Chitinivibrionales bacterium]